MAAIDSLNISILEMTSDAVIDLMKTVRASRRVMKKTTTKSQKATIKKPAAPPKGLTQEAARMLIRELEETMR